MSCVSSNFFKTEHQLNVSLKLKLFIPSLYAYIEFTSVNVKHEAVLFYVQFLAIQNTWSNKKKLQKLVRFLNKYNDNFFKSPVKWYPPVHYQPRPRSPRIFQRRSPGDEDFMGVFFRRVRAKKSKVRSMGWRISFSFSFIIHLFDFGTEECLIFVASLALCQDPKLLPVIAFRERLASSEQNGYLFQGW